MPANTPAYAGGGRRHVRGPIEVTPLQKKHKGDTSVVTDRKGDRFTVNPQKENVTVNPRTGVMDIKPQRQEEQMDIEKLMAIIRRQESGKFEGKYDAKSKTSSASGAYQFLDKTWRGLTKKLNIGTQYKSAKDAPKEVQEAVAKPYFENLRKKFDDETILKVHFTGNPEGRMSKKAMAANRGMNADQYVKSIIQTHGPEYDKIASKSGGAEVAASKVSEPKLQTSVGFAEDLPPAPVEPTKTAKAVGEGATPPPAPTPEQPGGIMSGIRKFAEGAKKAVGTSTGQAETQVRTTPGSSKVTVQPPPQVGPAPAAAESVGITQTPDVRTKTKIDTGTIIPGKTSQFDLLREELRSGFQNMQQPKVAQAPKQMPSERPDFEHQQIISSLPNTVKNPFGTPSLERAAGRASFNEGATRQTGNDFSFGNKT